MADDSSKGKARPKSAGKQEVLQFKSPAEFFAENQNIAGFDNAGKALYTTIREFVENSLDAAESARRLPDIVLTIEEMDTPTFNRVRGLDTKRRVDKDLYQHGGGGDGGTEDGDSGDEGRPGGNDGDSPGGGGKKRKRKAGADGDGDAKKRQKGGKGDDAMYYRVTCRDNGCGMPHDKIPDMLGRVLSGSKYGVRQTRGKFGLGAKMALIWSKKSTGMPIEVRSAHAAAKAAAEAAGSGATSAAGAAPAIRAPARVSYCKLDIDIYKNVPHVHEHTLSDNSDGFVGTEISVVISGSWSSYRSRVMQYFQQLAVITPYAEFALHYSDISDGGRASNFSFVWRRRSTQIPRPPLEVKHHPSAVNDLLVRQLIDASKLRAASATLVGFLTTQFSCIDKPLAQRLVRELGAGFTDGMTVAELTPKQVHQVSRLLAVAKFPAPSSVCLSPAGEYNLRLGVMKELRPDLVATHSAAVAVFEGHPFIVEAAVALGGRGPEGVTVHRFANRIPLLFEGGADVATRTATSRIPWTKYKIDPVRDKVGVFVSLVSTKVPFKGTGKEYIGDDVMEIRDAVREALLSCCAQLRVKLLRAQALRARANRRKTLVKYVPDATRAIVAAMKAMSARHAELGDMPAIALKPGTGPASATGAPAVAVPSAAALLAPLRPGSRAAVLASFVHGEFTDTDVSTRLLQAVEKADLDAALEHAAAATTGLTNASSDTGAGAGAGAATLFIAPAGQAVWRSSPDVHHATCVIKFLPGALVSSVASAHALESDDDV